MSIGGGCIRSGVPTQECRGCRTLHQVTKHHAWLMRNLRTSAWRRSMSSTKENTGSLRGRVQEKHRGCGCGGAEGKRRPREVGMRRFFYGKYLFFRFHLFAFFGLCCSAYFFRILGGGCGAAAVWGRLPPDARLGRRFPNTLTKARRHGRVDEGRNRPISVCWCGSSSKLGVPDARMTAE